MGRHLCIAVALAIVGGGTTDQALSQAEPKIQMRTGSPQDFVSPLSIEEMTRTAAVVLRAKLTNRKSYLLVVREGVDYVLTDYEMAQPQVITGWLPSANSSMPFQVTPLVLVVSGGDVTVDGTRILEDDPNRSEITEGREYLLFLRKVGPEPGRYALHYLGIFEIKDGYATALARDAEYLFKGVRQAPANELIDRIQSHVRMK